MINKIKEKIVLNSHNPKDIHHLLKVHSFATMISNIEVEDQHVKDLIEIEALVHDIACPLCRIKYGNTNGHYQEIESKDLLLEFFKDIPINDQDLNQIIYVVSHHHTYTNVKTIDHQILLEADFLVNSYEMNLDIKEIIDFRNNVFKTNTGIQLVNSIYNI